MSATEHEVHLSHGKKVEYTARIEVDKGNKRVNIVVHKSQHNSTVEIVRGSWVIEYDPRHLIFDIAAFQSAANTTCLLGCLIGAGASMADCIRKAKTEDDVWECINNNVVVLGGGVIGCVISCLN